MRTKALATVICAREVPLTWIAAKPPPVCTVHVALLSVFVSSLLPIMLTVCCRCPSSLSSVVMVMVIVRLASGLGDRQSEIASGRAAGSWVTLSLARSRCEACEAFAVVRAGVVVVCVLIGWSFPRGCVVFINRISLRWSYADRRARGVSPRRFRGPGGVRRERRRCRNIAQEIGWAVFERFSVLDTRSMPQLRDRVPPTRRWDQLVGPRHSTVDPVLSPHLVCVALVVVVPIETTLTRVSAAPPGSTSCPRL